MRNLIKLATVLLVVSCGPDGPHRVDVELSTSLTPGVDFVWVDTDIATFREGRPGQIVMREQLRARYERDRTLDWGRGIHVAGFDTLPSGSYMVRVALRSIADDAILVQEAFVDVFEDTTVRLRLDRGCIAAQCPAAGGSAALSACRQAACVDPRCDPTDVDTRDELCPSVAFCEADADCPAPAAGCASAICVDGTCLDAPAAIDSCPGGQYCDTRLGCRALNDPLPQCGTLCDLRDDDCAIGYWNCDLLPPRCDAVSAVPPGTMCLRGDATMGACDPRGSCVECVEGAMCTSGCLIGHQICGEGGASCDTSEFDVVTPGTACVQPTGRPGFCDATGGCGSCPVGGCAAEVCNGIDDDMDGSIDEEASDATVYYVDVDGDGFGDMALEPACDKPPGTALVGGDCDDDNRERFPGAPTFCNGDDDDCDGNSDENVPTWYVDNDGDGVGGAVAAMACAGPPGSVSRPGDCNDDAAAVYPGAPELCDGLDNNCAGGVDEGDPGGGEACGSAVGECTEGALRCAGGSLVCVGGRRPSTEICDGLDNDCNGVEDNGNPGGGAACDPDGACNSGTQECVDGGLVCSPGPACDCTPDLPCALSNPCQMTGRTNCDTGVSVCRGVPRADGFACGTVDLGPWSACGGYDATCDETGSQSRVAVRPACMAGVCNSDPIDETRACARDQTGVMCAATTTGDPGPCMFMTCRNDGASARVRTDYACREGTCDPQNTTLFDPCTRNTEGTSCGAVVLGGWGACSYANACANQANEQRMVTTPTCASQMCDMRMTTETRGCGSRDTTGTVCGGPTPGPWGPCISDPVECAVMGRQQRDVARVECAAQSCTNMITQPEFRGCTVPSDGTRCGDPIYGEWGECEYRDSCVTSGYRSRPVLRLLCASGSCEMVEDVETMDDDACRRADTSRNRCAVDPDAGWTPCTLIDCLTTTGAEYHIDDGHCEAERCVSDREGVSNYAISRVCKVPRPDESACFGEWVCGVGTCQRDLCVLPDEPPKCTERVDYCCGDACLPIGVECGIKTSFGG